MSVLTIGWLDPTKSLLCILCTTYIFNPMGGVMNDTSHILITMIPNQIGS